MNLLLESLKTEWENLVRLAPQILLALVVFIAMLLIGRLIGRLVVQVIARGHFKPTHRNFFRSLTSWLFALLGIILALNILGLRSLAASLVAGGGITAVVLGFAFREIGENFLAGFFLAFSRPFEIGDLIRSGEFQGLVRGIELRSTHIRSADGRDIFIPSSQIFNSPLVNFTKDGLRRISFTVGIDYGDDSQRARELLAETVRKVPTVLADPLPTVYIADLAAGFVVLEVSFWVDTFASKTDQFAVRNEAMEKTRMALAEGGFTFSSNVSNNIDLSTRKPLELVTESGAA